MEALPLDPGDYSGSYKLVGGRPALDFVNTVSWPGTARQHDWLHRLPNVARWLAAIDLDIPHLGASDLPAIYEARRVITRVLRPLAEGRAPDATSVDELNHRLRRAMSRRRLNPVERRWEWAEPERPLHVLDALLLDAADLITTGEPGRLKHCPSCRWLFEDRTRNGGRRWCDMADCGSRAKARAYYHRRKAAAD